MNTNSVHALFYSFVDGFGAIPKLNGYQRKLLLEYLDCYLSIPGESKAVRFELKALGVFVVACGINSKKGNR